MIIHLLIHMPGRHEPVSVQVEDALMVRDCAVLLARQLGYPDSLPQGTPVAYLLFSGGQALPGNRSLADLHVESGTHLHLDCAESRYATIPVASLSAQTTLPRMRGLRWSRRSVVVYGSILTGAALTGLGSGWTFALASRALARSGGGQANALPPPQHFMSLNAAFHFTGHQRKVRAVAWSPDGTLLASGGDDAQVLVWTPDGATQSAIAHQSPVQSLAWSPESRRLITGSASQVRFCTALSGSTLAIRNHRSQVTSVAWSGKGQTFAASGAADQRAIVWQTDHFQPQTIFAGHTTPIQAVTFSADGQAVASSSQGGAVRVWDAANGGELHPLYQDTRLPILALAFAPSSGTLAAGSNDGVTRLWDGLHCRATLVSGQGPVCADVPQHLQHSQQIIRAVAWSPDAGYLASGAEDGTLAIWSLTRPQAPILLKNIQPNTPIHSIAWSPDGKRLVTAASTTVTIWNLIP